MTTQPILTRSRRSVIAALLLLSVVPLGAVRSASAACDPLIPPQVCNLLPSAVDTAPIDQTTVVGKTYVPANPAVKTGEFLYMHNFDTAVHFFVFSNGTSKRLAATEFGPRAQKLLISLGNGFTPGASYTFFCAAFPEMQGELTVLKRE